jgi:DNA-directed RNA polymerase specialized sigma24 family protein
MAIKDDEFESLVREHEGMLYGIAFNFFLSTSIAEDVVQEVL